MSKFRSEIQEYCRSGRMKLGTKQVGKGCLTGISIESDSFRIVSLNKKGDEHSVRHGSVFTLNPDKLRMHGESYVSKELSNAVQALELDNHNVSVSISGEHVTVHQLAFPSMPQNELRSAIEANLISIFEEDAVENYYWDYLELTSPTDSQILVLVILINREYLDAQLNIISKAGLNPLGVEFAPIAFWNSIFVEKEESDKTIGLLHIGKHEIQVCIYHENKLTYYRDIPTNLESLKSKPSGITTPSNIEDSFSEKKQPDDVEQSFYQEVQNVNLDKDQDATLHKDQSASENTQTQSEVSTKDFDALDSVCLEIQRSFDYAKVHNRSGDLCKLYVSGELQIAESIISKLSPVFEQPVILADPIKHIPVESDVEEVIYQQGPNLVIPTGLALKESSLPALLPQKYKDRAQRRRRKGFYRRISYGLTCLLLVVAGLSIVYHTQLAKQVKGLNQKLSGIQSDIHSYAMIQQQHQSVENERQALLKISGTRIPVHTLMLIVSKLIHRKMVLIDMKY